MTRDYDPIELEYLRAIRGAEACHDDALAYELQVGLGDYRKNFKAKPEKEER